MDETPVSDHTDRNYLRRSNSCYTPDLAPEFVSTWQAIAPVISDFAMEAIAPILEAAQATEDAAIHLRTIEPTTRKNDTYHARSRGQHHGKGRYPSSNSSAGVLGTPRLQTSLIQLPHLSPPCSTQGAGFRADYAGTMDIQALSSAGLNLGIHLGPLPRTVCAVSIVLS